MNLNLGTSDQATVRDAVTVWRTLSEEAVDPVLRRVLLRGAATLEDLAQTCEEEEI
jgi:hypothetical protein